MTSFHADPKDLSDRIAYELETLEYLRVTLYGQGEASAGGMSLTLGDLTPDGELRRAITMSLTIGMSDAAVRAALDRFRPLAFGAAFKIQDMIAEWVLRANGEHAWQFVKKIEAYDRLRTAGTLKEPPLFTEKPQVARATWELYRFLVPFRSTVVHSGGVALGRDGTISITSSKHGNSINLSPTEQASYLRAVCLMAKIFAGQAQRDPFLDDLIEGDLHGLSTYHSERGLVVRGARVEALTVYVPQAYVVRPTPLAVQVDFDVLRATMERTFPPPTNGKLWFSASVVVDLASARFVWELPIEAVPGGTVTIQQGDLTFDRFLVVTTR